MPSDQYYIQQPTTFSNKKLSTHVHSLLDNEKIASFTVWQNPVIYNSFQHIQLSNYKISKYIDLMIH